MGACWRVTRDSIGQQWLLSVTLEPLQSLMIGRNSAERVTGIEPAWPAWKAGNVYDVHFVKHLVNSDKISMVLARRLLWALYGR